MQPEKASFAAAEPVEVRWIENFKNGGGVCEIPLLPIGKVNASMASSGSGIIDVTEQDIRSIVANFKKWPGPVPINRSPHRPFQATAGPAPGFVDALWFDENDRRLWGRLTLTPELAQELRNGEWRGFSVDMFKGAKLPTAEFKDWAMWGGVFTNRPATDITFVSKMAAELSADTCTVFSELNPRPDHTPAKETKMAGELDTASLEAKINEKESMIAGLEARVKDLTSEATTWKGKFEEAHLEAQRARGEAAEISGGAKRKDATIEQLSAQVTLLTDEKAALADKLKASETAQLATNIRRVVRKAVDEKDLPPAFFDGVDDDPVKWLQERFVSLEALEKQIAVFHNRTKSAAFSSGNSPVDDDGKVTLSAEAKADLKRKGLNPDYAHVTRSDQLPPPELPTKK